VWFNLLEPKLQKSQVFAATGSTHRNKSLPV